MDAEERSRSFAADPSRGGGGADATRRRRAGDPGPAEPRRGREADRARARRRREDGEALAAARARGGRAAPAAAAAIDALSATSSGGAARRSAGMAWSCTASCRALGFTGGYLQVQRFAAAAAQRRGGGRAWRRCASRRAPGQQAQVDFGQLRVWIGRCSRRHRAPLRLHARLLAARASRMPTPNERLASAARRPRAGLAPLRRRAAGLSLRQSAHAGARPARRARCSGIRVFEDFARYYGFTPRACQPYRPQTKGKVESGVKYVKRNALAGRRFGSWDGAQRLARGVVPSRSPISACTARRTSARSTASPPKALTPLGSRPPYRYQRVQTRIVPADALVAIAAARYSVPVRYVGHTVTVHETATHYELVVDGDLHRAAREGGAPRRRDGAGALRRPAAARRPSPSPTRRRDGIRPISRSATSMSAISRIYDDDRASGRCAHEHARSSERLHAHCQRLRLYRSRPSCTTLLEQAAKRDLGYADFLDELLALEIRSKAEKHLTMRVRDGALPVPQDARRLRLQIPALDRPQSDPRARHRPLSSRAARTSCCSGRPASARRISPSRSGSRRASTASAPSSRPRPGSSPRSARPSARIGSTSGSSSSASRSC